MTRVKERQNKRLHGLIMEKNQVEMIVIAENIKDQIEQKGLCNHFMKRERVKTALRAFTYSYIDISDKQYSHDKKKIDIKQLREKYMINVME